MGIETSWGDFSYFYRGQCWNLAPGSAKPKDFPATQKAQEDRVKHLRELFDQGVPFFSKDVFRQILEQLEHCPANPRQLGDANSQTISLPTLDGAAIECELETGDTSPHEKDTECVAYVKFQVLKWLPSGPSLPGSLLAAEATLISIIERSTR